MNIYNYLVAGGIEHAESHYSGEPFDSFMFKDTIPWVHSKRMIKKNIAKYNLNIKRIKLKF